jgi:3-oxoacyl-ACP reductase-like protein
MDIAARYDGCPSGCKFARVVIADDSTVTWQLNGELLKTPQDIARYARSTRALLTSQAQDKTAEQRMIDIMDHAISVLQGPVGEQVSPEPSMRADKQGSIPRGRRRMAVVHSLRSRIGLLRVSGFPNV